MERVQFEQEQMLAELKDLGQKGLFSPAEIKQIIKKRTAFEIALVRRIPKKNDYLRYAAYEMSLEALRRKRVERLKLQKSPPSISDYALTRRQFQIFERALKKFKSDVSLWLEYLRVAQRAHAHALAGRIAARAVQLHPRTPALYVLAAAHELAHGGMGAARALLLRGLRLNAACADMWREYVRLEMGFVEAVRRRWDVLGISLGDAASSSSASSEQEQEQEQGPDQDRDRDQGGLLMLSERVDRKMGQEAATMIGDDDEARRAIMDGAIVRQVIDSATKALPTIELFQHLQSLIAGYPVPELLRTSLLDHLHARLAEVLPRDAAAVALRATRGLTLTSAAAEGEEPVGGAALVDALRHANEEMLAALDDADDVTERCHSRDELAGAYAQFVEEWCGREDLDAHLKLYLVGSLHALIQRQRGAKAKAKETAPSAVLLATHIRLLLALAHLQQPPAPASPSRILSIARRYTSTSTSSTGGGNGHSHGTLTTDDEGRVWLARLQAELAHGTADSLNEAWTRARRAAFDALLAESMCDAALREVHESLLVCLAKSIGGGGALASTTAEKRTRVEHIAKRCLPSARVWANVFAALTAATEGKEKEDKDEEALVREVYEYWRGTGDVEEATLAWASWLLVSKKRGDEAIRVISRARGGAGAGGGGGASLARRWAAIVRAGQGQGGNQDQDQGSGSA
ncbi:U3 small nucleolar RNA-associated protein 6-domain-containing protein [Russula compacta]|nr:U3 small nucleolar RNA-associated protein 6-domain-containing protein [Russula compacta]